MGLWCIVADRDQAKALSGDIRVTALQLHELRFAVRSPIGGPKEHEHRAFRAVGRCQRVRLSQLVDAGECGHLRAHLGAQSCSVDNREPGSPSQTRSRPAGPAIRTVDASSLLRYLAHGLPGAMFRHMDITRLFDRPCWQLVPLRRAVNIWTRFFLRPFQAPAAGSGPSATLAA